MTESLGMEFVHVSEIGLLTRQQEHVINVNPIFLDRNALLALDLVVMELVMMESTAQEIVYVMSDGIWTRT
jgi:hypothetical protein